MQCTSSGLNESELLVAVLLPVCMVALIVVAVAVYCTVMSTSLCQRGPWVRRAQPDELTRLQIEAAVADAIARDRRNTNNASNKTSSASSGGGAGGHHKNKKLRSSSRRHRHSHENADEFKSQLPLSATAHEKFIASSVHVQQQQQQQRRPDGDYDSAPVEFANVPAGKGAPTTKAIAYDIVQPHQDDPSEESRSGNDCLGGDK